MKMSSPTNDSSQPAESGTAKEEGVSKSAETVKHSRTPWTLLEDDILRSCCSGQRMDNISWKEVARHLLRRRRRECRDRWLELELQTQSGDEPSTENSTDKYEPVKPGNDEDTGVRRGQELPPPQQAAPSGRLTTKDLTDEQRSRLWHFGLKNKREGWTWNQIAKNFPGFHPSTLCTTWLKMYRSSDIGKQDPGSAARKRKMTSENHEIGGFRSKRSKVTKTSSGGLSNTADESISTQHSGDMEPDPVTKTNKTRQGDSMPLYMSPDSTSNLTTDLESVPNAMNSRYNGVRGVKGVATNLDAAGRNIYSDDAQYQELLAPEGANNVSGIMIAEAHKSSRAVEEDPNKGYEYQRHTPQRYERSTPQQFPQSEPVPVPAEPHLHETLSEEAKNETALVKAVLAKMPARLPPFPPQVISYTSTGQMIPAPTPIKSPLSSAEINEIDEAILQHDADVRLLAKQYMDKAQRQRARVFAIVRSERKRAMMGVLQKMILDLGPES